MYGEKSDNKDSFLRPPPPSRGSLYRRRTVGPKETV